jgi:hypothetical protein
MGRAKPDSLKDLASEFAKIEKLAGVKHKSFGTFYYKNTPLLHFHEKDGKRWADLRIAEKWQKVEIDFSADAKVKKQFLGAVTEAHQALHN